MDNTKILSTIIENLHSLDSPNYLHMRLKSMHKSFDVTCKEGFNPQFFKTPKNLDCVGPHPETKFHGADYLSVDERTHFLKYFDEQKDKLFFNKQELLPTVWTMIMY